MVGSFQSKTEATMAWIGDNGDEPKYMSPREVKGIDLIRPGEKMRSLRMCRTHG